MTRTRRTARLLVVLTALVALPSQAQRAEQMAPPHTVEDLGSHVLATAEVAADLVAGDAKERVTGRASIYLVATPKGMRAGYMTVRGFNILFSGVSQRLLAPEARIDEALGLLGFAVVSGKPQTLKYDPQTGRLAGELRMFADASFLSIFARPETDGKNDLFLTPTIPVTAAIDLALEKPLTTRGVIDQESRAARLHFKLQAEASSYERFKFHAFDVRLIHDLPIKLEVFPFPWFEVAQRLCVQPVRLLRFSWTGWFPLFQLSGAGLAFGQPGARTQWAKADVVFNIRDWKTIFSNTYWELDSGESAGLRATVDDDDCVEVFFPYDLDPDDLWGGGATFGSGTASAKIISSDGNARGGVDFTHLAHELGHVLGLRHPGDPATASAVPASSGTLMCPSGYLNDNPQINSQENADLLSNPLLTFAIKFRGPGPDCNNSADCGACPAIP